MVNGALQGGKPWFVASRASAGLPGSLELLPATGTLSADLKPQGLFALLGFSPLLFLLSLPHLLILGWRCICCCHCVLELQL